MDLNRSPIIGICHLDMNSIKNNTTDFNLVYSELNEKRKDRMPEFARMYRDIIQNATSKPPFSISFHSEWIKSCQNANIDSDTAERIFSVALSLAFDPAPSNFTRLTTGQFC